MNTTTKDRPEQATSPKLLIAPNANIFAWLDCCAHAQTYTAYTTEASDLWLIPLTCKQWSCRHCAEAKIRRLAYRTGDAKPNRLLTLTVATLLWPNPRAAFDGTRRQVPALMRLLRERYGEVEYMRVTELTAAGWPHYHLLVRSAYLPHAVIKKLWQQLTGAYVVDVRQVRQSWSAYRYLTKYLSKLHSIAWTERHVSYSRKFFPPEKPRPPDDRQFIEPSILPMHPAKYLAEAEQGATIERVTANLYRITKPKSAPGEF